MSLSKIKYENILPKFIKTLNSLTTFFKNEIKENTKAFIYNSKIKVKDLLIYRFDYIEKGLTFSRITARINDSKIKNKEETFKTKAISSKDNQIPSLIYKNTYQYLLNELDKIFKFDNKRK